MLLMEILFGTMSSDLKLWLFLTSSMNTSSTVVPVMNGHPRDQAKVSVHCRWPLIRGNLTLKCVGRGIDNVAVQGRWPLTTGVAQGRYYCSQTTTLQCFGCVRRILQCTFNTGWHAHAHSQKKWTSCTRHWPLPKYTCLCQDGANYKQRSQETNTDHRVDSHIAWRWLWSNSTRHLTIVIYLFNKTYLYRYSTQLVRNPCVHGLN